MVKFARSARWWIMRRFRVAYFGPFGGLDPGMMRLGDCESLASHSKTETMVAEKYRGRRFLSIQQALEEGELDNVYWAPGAENPADGLTKVRGDMAPLLRRLESGHLNDGSLRALKGAAWKE